MDLDIATFREKFRPEREAASNGAQSRNDEMSSSKNN
jgi:hypothetical protein